MSSSAAPPPAGFELPLRLLAAFRLLIDALHERLAAEGHPDARPLHGFVLQALGPDGTTAAELGRRLGVSKQAAGKTVEALERQGYVARRDDPADARRRVVVRTARGTDLLARSARIFDELRAEWAAELGERRLAALEDALRAITPAAALGVDLPGWFGGGRG